MDARLDTLSSEMYQVNVHVIHIARWQAVMGGFTLEASLLFPLVTFDAEDDDDDGDDADASDANDDRDASFTDEMST